MRLENSSLFARLKSSSRSDADAVVLALNGSDLSSETVLEHVVFVREHLHGLLIGEKVFEMIQDKNANALFGIGNFIQPLAQPLNDGAEGVLLNQVQQFLFGLEIVVKSGQGHAAGARQDRAWRRLRILFRRRRRWRAPESWPADDQSEFPRRMAGR